MKACEWQPMTADDLDGVAEVAMQTFVDHFEEQERFAERLALGEKYCAVLRRPDGSVCGYLLAYPSPIAKLPALNEPIGLSAQEAEAVYISDLAVLPEARGTGVTRPVINRVVRQAKEDGFKAVTLVGSTIPPACGRGMAFSFRSVLTFAFRWPATETAHASWCAISMVDRVHQVPDGNRCVPVFRRRALCPGLRGGP